MRGEQNIAKGGVCARMRIPVSWFVRAQVGARARARGREQGETPLVYAFHACVHVCRFTHDA